MLTSDGTLDWLDLLSLDANLDRLSHSFGNDLSLICLNIAYLLPRIAGGICDVERLAFANPLSVAMKRSIIGTIGLEGSPIGCPVELLPVLSQPT